MKLPYILIVNNPPELLAVCPNVGAFTGYHRSNRGTNLCTQGSNKALIIRTIRDQARNLGLPADEHILDQTEAVSSQ